MSSKSQLNLPPALVNRVDREPERALVAVNKVDHAEIPLDEAKERVGAAVEQAIGDRPMKHFGDKGLLCKVCTGEKAPDYLARIYQDPSARRRFARAWLKDDNAVRVKVVYEFPEERIA